MSLFIGLAAAVSCNNQNGNSQNSSGRFGCCTKRLSVAQTVAIKEEPVTYTTGWQKF